MTIDPSPDEHLDHLMQGLGAIDPKLPAATHAAILARVMAGSAGEADHFGSAVIEVAPSHGHRWRSLALGLGLAVAAAFASAWLLRPATEQDPAATVIDGGVAAAARVVPPSDVEGERIAGNKLIAPGAATREKMAKDGNHRVVASVKLCVNTQGKVGNVTLLKSSGYPDYDRELVDGISAWAYRPRSDEVCTAVTFIFSMD